MLKTRTRLALLLVFSLLILRCAGETLAQSPVDASAASAESHVFKHNGRARKYLLYLPRELPKNAPLVMMLHGYRVNARGFMHEMGMNRLADANGFAVCYPQGTRDFTGVTHWNARLKMSQTDDIGFLSELAADLQTRHQLGSDRTFVCGISNGGFMSFTLVAEKPGVFRAAASVMGTMSGHTWEHREMIRPVSVLQISCLKDNLVPYDGSMPVLGGWGGAPNQDEIMSFWKKLNETKTEEVMELSTETTAFRYRGGVDGNEVWHLKVKELGHRIPKMRNAGFHVADVVWDFFEQTFLPEGG